MLDALEPVGDEIGELQERILDFIPSESLITRQVLDHLLSGRGKLIRPALFFYCCRMINYRGDHKIPIAAVCEFVHSASLLHDDVIDNSSLRRNKPTANKIWGDEASVLVGDLIYSRASELMAEAGSLELVETFARAIRLMSEGELLQLQHIFNLEITEQQYLRIVENKTAVLVSACCRAAGLLARADGSTLSALSNYGRSVGLAFQLVDDALDYRAEDGQLGKPTGHDLVEGKITMPLIRLRQVAQDHEWQHVKSLAEVGFTDGASEIVNAMIHKYQTIDFTLDLAREYSNAAIAALEHLPVSAIKDKLIELTHHLVWREV